jgi:hypothetical protein
MADLQTERAKIDGERKMVEAELGPIRYLTTLIGAATRTSCASSIWSSRCCSIPRLPATTDRYTAMTDPGLILGCHMAIMRTELGYVASRS